MEYWDLLSARRYILILLSLLTLSYACFSFAFLHLWKFPKQGKYLKPFLTCTMWYLQHIFTLIDLFDSHRHNSLAQKVFPDSRKLEIEAREMLRVHASIKNEMLLIERDRRSLIQMKSNLESQIIKLRNDYALTERDLLRAQVHLYCLIFH